MKQACWKSRRAFQIGLCLLGALFPGCASIANFAAMRSIPVASPQNPVVDFACIWQQGEGRDEHGKPCRGFCGQLMFLTATSKKPAVVHGGATIYVFDNVGTPEEQAKPFKTFSFTPEEWTSFQRRTNLGMTYQLFIPYTRPGNHDAECQLHVRFDPVGGSTIYATPESIGLRGKSAGPAAMADAIDRKLTSSSKLFQNPSVMKTDMALDPSYADMVRKMTEAQTSAARPPVAAPVQTVQPVQKKAEIARLQAILDNSTPRQVQQADYSGNPARRQRVSQAVHEEDEVQ